MQEGAEQQQQEEEPTARGGSAVRKNSPWVGRWDEPKAPSRIMSLPSLMAACHSSQQVAASHDLQRGCWLSSVH